MALIDVVEWSTQSTDMFAYKHPNNNLSTGTQLIVRESQEAVFFSKGQILGKFGPGKHTLSTENLPLLRNLFGIPFGGKNPFFAEVWFVNKTAPLNIDWKTDSMRYMDPEYGQMIPVIAEGRYGLKVKDAERFLVELVGSLSNYTARDLKEHFYGALVAKTKSVISQYMRSNNLGINSISGYLDDLSTFLKQFMAEFWEGYGFSLPGFYLTSVDLDRSTEEGRKISDALSDRSAQAIAGYTWQQKQAFDTANNAVNNSTGGAMGGIMGVAMMTGAFSGGNGMGGGVMGVPNPNQYSMNNMGQMQGGMAMQQPVREIFCANCGKKYDGNMAFCPHCGKQKNPCPSCGGDNTENAKRCVRCGTMLSNMQQMFLNQCSKCQTEVQPGLKFCPRCGNKL